jgi:RNA recognition motif-containing protein
MNIFVARLNFKTRSEELEKAFAPFGQVVSAKIVKDRDTGSGFYPHTFSLCYVRIKLS